MAADPRLRPTAAEVADTLSRTAASRRPSLPPTCPNSPPRPVPRTAELPASPDTPHPLNSGGAQAGRLALTNPPLAGRAASLPEPAQQRVADRRRQSLGEASREESLPSLPSWIGSGVVSPAASLPSPMHGGPSSGVHSPEPPSLTPGAATVPGAAAVTGPPPHALAGGATAEAAAGEAARASEEGCG